MRNVLESIRLYKEIQAEVSQMDQEALNKIEREGRERSITFCTEAVNLLKPVMDDICPVAICSVMECFPEAIGWAYVLTKEPDLRGWPKVFFQTTTEGHEVYAQAMWDSTEEMAATMGNEAILQALRESITEHKLSSFFDCCAAGYWLGLPAESVASIWLNFCLYTPELLKTSYKVGDNQYARELFLQRVEL